MRTLSSEARAEMPPPVEVEALWFAAARLPPLNEDEAPAAIYARVYAQAHRNEDLTAVTFRREGTLVGFAYGHPWQWANQDYPWAHQLRNRLGEQAGRLEDTMSLNLLVRSPTSAGQGIGSRVLNRWLAAVDPRPVWLQTTDISSDAVRLYRRAGFTPIGYGPDAPDQRPGRIYLRAP